MVGIFAPDQRANGLLRLAVGLGDGIESCSELVCDIALAAESRQGLGGSGLSDLAHELRRNVQIRVPNCCAKATAAAVKWLSHIRVN